MSDTIVIEGKWFGPETSNARTAELSVAAANQLDARITFSTGEEIHCDIVAVSDRLSGVERRLELSNGQVFITSDDDAVEQLSGLRRGWFAGVSKLEIFHPRLIGFVVAIILLIFATVRWGLPVFAKVAVWATPQEVVQWIDAGSLSTIDNFIVGPSQLDETTRTEIADQFSKLTKANNRQQEFNLQFRSGGRIGANALALPAGTIIVTDPLVKLITRDELTAVLAHEIAHVNESHGLQQLYRALGFAGLTSLITGDLGVVSEEILSGGSVLVAMAASREMELDADARAIRLLRQINIDPNTLTSGLDKLYASVCKGQINACEESGWFSSHPGGEQRRKALEAQISKN